MAAMIHGDRSQSQRNGALSGLQEGRFQILVATDIASRGFTWMKWPMSSITVYRKWQKILSIESAGPAERASKGAPRL
jgi:late competence protein required for DNA uptake (superfamily II DNA/RNA helicase)